MTVNTTLDFNPDYFEVALRVISNHQPNLHDIFIASFLLNIYLGYIFLKINMLKSPTAELLIRCYSHHVTLSKCGTALKLSRHMHIAQLVLFPGAIGPIWGLKRWSDFADCENFAYKLEMLCSVFLFPLKD